MSNPEAQTPAEKNLEGQSAEEGAATPADESAAPASESESEVALATSDAPMSASSSETATATTEAPEGADDAQVEEKDEEDKPIPYELVASETKEGSILHVQFKVAYDEYASKTKDIFEDLAKETQIPGFRRGKAPLPLLRSRFRKEVADDALVAIRHNVLAQYVEGKSIDVLSQPEFEEMPEIQEGEPLVFSVDMEVRPTLEKIEYGDLEVEVETREVTDKMVEDELEQLRQSHVDYIAKSEGAVIEEKDMLILDMEVKDDRDRAIEHMTRPDFRIANVKEHLPAPVAEALLGKKVGDVVEVSVENPRHNRAGAVVSEKDHYKAAIKEIQGSKVPELDDEFAKDLGEYADLAALRAEIRKRLTEMEENRQRSESVEKICDKLMEKNPMDAPRSVVASSAQRLLQEQYYQMAISGVNMMSWTDEQRAAMVVEQNARAMGSTRRALLLEEIGRLEKVEVTDEDLDAEIERMAQEQGRRALAIRAQLEAQKRLEAVREGLTTRKVADFLIGKATIKHTPAADAAKG